ncbi:MAG: ATP-binding protein [Desulfobacterota bacterium]|nr:ATP-binding protein [Thermodesulfobacteriota bacterium]
MVAAMVQGMPDGCVVFDSQGQIAAINHTAATVLGCTDPHQAAARIAALTGVDPSRTDTNIRRKCKVGTSSVFITVAPLQRGTDRFGTAVFFHDIGSLEQVDELTSDFISIASHELRNPLAALKNALEILRSGSCTHEQSERFLAIAVRNTQRIAELIEQYLEMTRLETGTAPCSLTRVQLADVVHGLMPEFQTQAAAAGIEVRMICEDNLPPALADAHRIEQILFNLVGNALKFTPPGGMVTIAVSRSADADAPAEAPEMLTVSVTDTGIGIPKDQRHLIFRKFYRIQRSHEIKSTGVGLGLAIVQQLVGMHGGKVSVEDNHPRGTRFSFTVPVYGSERRDPTLRRIFDREFHRIQRQGGQLALCIVVVDHLPESTTAAAIRHAIQGSLHRPKDVVVQRKDDTVFVVFCETHPEGSRTICNRIRKALQAVIASTASLKGNNIGIGCAVYPDDAQTQQELYRLALSRAQEDAYGGQKDSHR